MNKPIIALVLGLTIILSSCSTKTIKPSGNVISEKGPSGTFERVDAGAAFDVFITYSESENNVEIKADDNLMSYIDVRGNGNTLDIGLDNNINVKSNATLEVHITSSEMRYFNGSGATDIRLTNTFPIVEEIDLSGASEFEGTIEAVNMDIELSGASEITLIGDVSTVYVSLTGACQMNALGLVIETLDATLTGASEAKVTVINELSVDLSGASTLKYAGDPTIISQEITGASELIKL